MSKQLINKLFGLANGQKVSSREILSLIYKHLEEKKELEKFPALSFARHLQNHSIVSRDPFAYESLLKMISIFLNILKLNDYSSHYQLLTNSALPIINIANELNLFCKKKINKNLSSQGFSNFISDFLNSFDDETLVSFDPKSSLYKKTNIEQSLNAIFDTQNHSQPFQITKLNRLIISRDIFWGKGESIIIGVNVDTLQMPQFNGTIINEIENLTFKLEFARIN